MCVCVFESHKTGGGVENQGREVIVGAGMYICGERGRVGNPERSGCKKKFVGA